MSKYLITGDWHVRSDTLICRVDNLQETQRECLNEVAYLAKKYKVDAIINAGDTFNSARPDKAQELEIMLYDIFKIISVYFIPGNHELLFHRVENIDKGSIGVISRYDNWNNELYDNFNNVRVVLNNYGLIDIPPASPDFFNIAVMHRHCSEKQTLFFIKDGITASDLLKENPDYNLIITGDNHHGFIYEEDGRFVINPGCLNRQAADMKTYKPFVVIFDTEELDHEQIYLLDNNPDDVTEEHLIKNEERDERINAFVESLKTNKNISLSFEDNLRGFMDDNILAERTEEILLELMEVK